MTISELWTPYREDSPHEGVVYDVKVKRFRCGNCGEVWPCSTSLAAAGPDDDAVRRAYERVVDAVGEPALVEYLRRVDEERLTALDD